MALGRKLAGELEPGDLISVVGEVGAGKTALVQGIAQGLGISDRITSPSYLLIREHRDGQVPLFHVDAYRISDPAELIEIGIGDYLLEETGITAIEWGEKLVGLLPPGITVRLRITGPNDRSIEIIPFTGGDNHFRSFEMGEHQVSQGEPG